MEDLLGLEEELEEETSSDSNGAKLTDFDYTLSCPASGAAKCQKAYEYYAKSYGYNEIDNFNTANCKMSKDYIIQDYCGVCQ